MSQVVGSGGNKVIEALGKFMDLAKEHSEKMVWDEEQQAYVLVSEKDAGTKSTK